ncbi:16S rRNA (guanine(527)-N(7))-methyltransferase RsmG [Pseudooctadecabacter sp.]|uniref:16S rRNA (guanine(527)-N(7))-methyltransferase RsmG n=1 Tax=Pseudooctadecabacter sp. TaxID=1966338 RepID=UPI0025FB07D0|nr:16S rRNA (guanine(527)-N(7))-methyltransferase RsmG [Pseudooctadecabacter sp.]
MPIVQNGALNVSRETEDRLKAFASLLAKWTRSINLIAPNSVQDLWDRHILDCAQIYDLAPPTWKSWTDIGSGGGLPAVVVAILDVEQRPITLVESDQRKCQFLKTAKRELDLNLSVHTARIDDISIPGSDILSARALAPLADLLSFSGNLLSADGVALFPKGARHHEEIVKARKTYDFDVICHPSHTHIDAAILEISRIRSREH